MRLVQWSGFGLCNKIARRTKQPVRFNIKFLRNTIKVKVASFLTVRRCWICEIHASLFCYSDEKKDENIFWPFSCLLITVSAAVEFFFFFQAILIFCCSYIWILLFGKPAIWHYGTSWCHFSNEEKWRDEINEVWSCGSLFFFLKLSLYRTYSGWFSRMMIVGKRFSRIDSDFEIH